MRLAAFAPAAVGLALFIVAVEIRMDGPWAEGVLALVAAVPAIVLLNVGLLAAQGDGAPRAAVTIFLVAGLALAGLAIARFGHALAGDGWLDGGGTLTWMLALFSVLASACAGKTRSAACLLIGSLATVALVLEATNWIFGAEDIDTFRVLLTIAFAVLLTGGLVVGGRDGTILAAAAGVTVLAGSYGTTIGLLFGGDGLGWVWELVMLLEALALIAFASQRLEPGPGYLAFFILALFVITAAAVGGGVGGGLVDDGQELPEPEASLVGWPLALGLGTVAAVLWGLRQTAPTRRSR